MRERIMYCLSLLDPRIAAGYFRVPVSDAVFDTGQVIPSIDRGHLA